MHYNFSVCFTLFVLKFTAIVVKPLCSLPPDCVFTTPSIISWFVQYVGYDMIRPLPPCTPGLM